MVKRIELFGPSGVGKSTLIDSVKDDLPNGYCFVSHLESKLSAMQQLLGQNVLSSIIDADPLGSILNQCVSKIASVDASANQKLLALNMLNTTIRRHRLLDFISTDCCWVVDDEHLLHRSFAVFSHSRKVMEDFEWYYNSVDVPHCAILCIADPQVVTDRVMARRKTVSSYRYDSKEDVFHLLKNMAPAYEKALSILRERGCRVHTLDLSCEVDEARGQFLRILGELTKGLGDARD